MWVNGERRKKKITLDIIGGGTKTYIDKLNKMIKEYGLEDSVHFLGYKEHVGACIGSYDCGLMCSKSEGFGKVTIEYMMAGLPVVASDIGTNVELVKNYENGLLYQWGNSLDLKEKIMYLVNHKELLEKMGKTAREYAQSHFSAELNAELIHKEYLKMMQKGYYDN